MISLPALTAALFFHLSRIMGPQRLVHAAYAAAALGLIYLLGAAAFGWEFDGQGALLWAYLALFIVVGAVAARRRATLGAIGLPWLSALIQLGVVAYMFAPESFRKPPVTAALFLYFVFEAVVWLRGREEESATRANADDRERPPLVPPKLRRGPGEVSLAAAALAIAYLLFVGPRTSGVAPDSATASQQEPQTGESAANSETAASEEPAQESVASDDAAKTGSAANEPAEVAPQVAAREPATPATKEPEVYTARAGDTFKSIAKRLYGGSGKWRAIAELNPEVRSKRLREGQLIKLPFPPTR